MRSYRKLADVQRELRELVFARRVEGGTRLDGERGLAEQLRAGRPTVSKALRLLEEDGLIRRTKNGVVILPLQQKFRYAYVAAVHMINNTFWFPAYKDLWMELERLAGRCGIRIELLPLRLRPAGTVARISSPAGRFRCGVFLAGHFPEEFFEGLLRMEKPRALLLSELLTHEGVPLYALDNFETGAMAARILLERGYRHPALLAPKFNTATADFRRRIDGFSAVMEENDCPFKLFSSSLLAGVEELNLLQQCVTQLYRRGYDSVFFLDDKWVMICDPLIEAGMTPEFGILAFDGTMTARTHNPPIDTLTHGTIPLARKICEIIFDWETGHFCYDPSIRFRIAPEYLRGRTLRPCEKQ
ncbi:MAG: GntR family transcriptional regulator [Lentisphaeria bacterium]|nr:MAG: GntR family transcriptional regulator [Lentisphaeria bacterium]